MSCCNRKRTALLSANGAAEPGEVWFRYHGARSIVVQGPSTGRAYRFLPGMMLEVKASDAKGFMGIPGISRTARGK